MSHTKSAKQMRPQIAAITPCCSADWVQKRHGVLRSMEVTIVIRSANKASKAAIAVAPAAMDK